MTHWQALTPRDAGCVVPEPCRDEAVHRPTISPSRARAKGAACFQIAGLSCPRFIEHRRLTRVRRLVLAACASVAELIVLFHERVDDVVAQSVLVSLFTIVILLTGLAHVLGGFRQATNSSVSFPARASCSE